MMNEMVPVARCLLIVACFTLAPGNRNPHLLGKLAGMAVAAPASQDKIPPITNQEQEIGDDDALSLGDGTTTPKATPKATANYPRYFDGNTDLDRALASAMLPPISPKCRRSTGTAGNSADQQSQLLFNVTMDFVSSNERSQWSPINAPYEQDIFLLEITIKHPINIVPDNEEDETTVIINVTSNSTGNKNNRNNTNKRDSNNNAVNVTIRLGTGGNIYSHYVEDHLNKKHGTRGKETGPPQVHESSPFNDEVWQMVSVNSKKNDRQSGAGHYKYFIHQAGTYLRDPNGGLGTETETETTAQDTQVTGNKTRSRAFSSPTVAMYCNTTEASCTVLSWGQHAHVPTIHKSNILYTTRYVACDSATDDDDGSVVLEVTNGLTIMIDPGDGVGQEHHSGDAIDYFNVPWGGVRESTLRDVLMSKPKNATQQATEFESQFRQQLHQQRAEERRRQRRYNRRHPHARHPQETHIPDLAVQDSTSEESDARKWLMSLLFSNSASVDNDKQNERHLGDKSPLPSTTSTSVPRLLSTDGNQTDGDSDTRSTLLHKPLPGFGSGGSYNVPKETGGYITFAQRVYDPAMESTPFHMPCVNTVSHKQVPCPSSKAEQIHSSSRKLNNHSTDPECDNSRGRKLPNTNDETTALERGEPLSLLDTEDDFHDVAFRSDMELLLATNKERMFETYYEAGTGLRPRLGNSDNQNDAADKGRVEQLKLVVSRTAAQPFSYNPGPSRVPIDDKHAVLTLELERTVPFEGKCLCILRFMNNSTRTLSSSTDFNIKALVVGVYAWARGGKWLHFLTAEGGGDPQKALVFFNNFFRGGDEIHVEYVNNGMPNERNMALTLIEGNKYHPQFEKNPSMARIGATYRDYLVYEASRLITLKPGMTYTKRHYLATGHLDQADNRAHEWLGEVVEEVHDFSKMSEVRQTATQIVLHSNADASVVGVTVGSGKMHCGAPGSMTLQRCQGYASPMPNSSVRLFAIECGQGANETYIGSDLYHFAPKGPLPGDSDEEMLYHRPYICDGHGIHGRRPRWKLLGFFPQGSCDSVQSAAFDSNFCDSGPSAVGSSDERAEIP